MIVSSRAGVDEVLRDPDVFSSNMSAHDLKTKRPLIPLQIDPPDHRKYRKLLDPLFAPQRMKAARGVGGPTRQRPHRRVRRRRRDRLLAAGSRRRSRRRCSSRCSGSRWRTSPCSCEMKDGVIRPDHVVGQRVRASRDRGVPAADGRLDLRVLRAACSTSARASERDDLLSHFLHAEVDGDRLTHEEILDICFLFLIAGLDTVTASLDCFFGYLAEHPDARRQARRRARRRSRRWSRSCCGGRRR